MQTYLNPEQQLHDPPHEVLDGQLTPYYERPARAEIIAAALEAAGFAPAQAPRRFGLGPVLAVHSEAYVEYLQYAHMRWVAAGRPTEAVQPSAMPLRGMVARSSSPAALAGTYAFDLSAPITAGTYAAARGSVDCALSAAACLLEGQRAAYALCRPPGHHAARDMAGGYCYLNNAAIAAHFLANSADEPLSEAASTQASAAEALRPLSSWGMRPATVAVLDIDVHHGNGTQAIFYERSDVFCASIHADPDREYPYFSGFADERGAGAGEGYNLNLPLDAGIADAGYLATLEVALDTIAAYGPRYLVVSAGLDTFAGDPLGDLQLTTPGYARIGARIAQLGLPTLFVQEGGYVVEALGANVVSLLRGFQEG